VEGGRERERESAREGGRERERDRRESDARSRFKEAHALIGPGRLVRAAANRNLCLLPLVVCLELFYDGCCVAHHVASDTKRKHEKKGSKVDEYQRERHASSMHTTDIQHGVLV
jgi:hypothetical protein